MTFVYETCCFVAVINKDEKPFSLCEKCWIEQGSPEGVKV
tara:strand:+ start:258 stop:377 length:120 start_codon:yes stop_codon:yes gene_type:complete